IKKRTPFEPLKNRHFIAKILAKFIKIWYNFIKNMNKL
ncbi:hypothetical protein cje135_07992, partial [Campylobacter jejuni subsp. jejuni ATCC 33560]